VSSTDDEQGSRGVESWEVDMSLYFTENLGSASSYFRVLIHWYDGGIDVTETETLKYELFSLECLSAIKKDNISNVESVLEDFLLSLDWDFVSSLSEEIKDGGEGVVEVVGKVTVGFFKSGYPDSYGDVDSDVQVDVSCFNVLTPEQAEELFKSLEDKQNE
jgi:hypothetical protein